MDKTFRVNQDKKKLGTTLKCSYMKKLLPIATIIFL